MQTVSTDFTNRSRADVRLLNKRVLMSFKKNYTPGANFYTIGVSSIGGPDPLKGPNAAISEWDKFDYEDFSDRVMSIEYTRSNDDITNPMTLAFADVVFDNSDDYFTPANDNSPLAGFLLPNRPIKIYLGFENEMISVFVGLTQGRPEIDEGSKTVRFHCLDFLNSIINSPVPQDAMFVDYRTDQIISALLQSAGLSITQFDLDVGTVIIPFAFAKKDAKLGSIISAVAQAELGNVRMSESGQPRFYNRTNWASGSIVWELDEHQIITDEIPTQDDVINFVEVYSQVRAVQELQRIWESTSAIEIPPNSEIDVFPDFKDDFGELPVTGVDSLSYNDVGTSNYLTNVAQDGSGDPGNTDVSITEFSIFSTAAKITFSNSASSPRYITALELWGTPARVIDDIYVQAQDDASVGFLDALDQRPKEIRNNYIQDRTAANSIAQILLADKSELKDSQKKTIKGIPQLQVGDIMHFYSEDTDANYFVTSINGIFNDSGFKQNITLSRRTINTYWRIGFSAIGGSDVLAP